MTDILLFILMAVSAVCCYEGAKDTEAGPVGGVIAWAIVWAVGFWLFQAGPFA